MTPDEVVIALGRFGINMTRRTLLNYEKWGIIPKPKRGGGGKGGRWTDYPEDTIEKAYAAWVLIHGDYIYHNQELKRFFDGRPPRISPSVIAAVLSALQSGNKESAEIVGEHKFVMDMSPFAKEDGTIPVQDFVFFHLFGFVQHVFEIEMKFAREVLKSEKG